LGSRIKLLTFFNIPDFFKSGIVVILDYTNKGNMKFKTEDLIELAEKAKLVAMIKGNYKESEYRYTIIYSDGSVGVIFLVGGCGYNEDESFEINFEDLDKDTGTLVAEHEEEKKRRKEKEEADKIAREEKEKIDKQMNEFAEYERLRKLFENK
jgi:NADH dehydrogenase/NADH:ubiquinone oxidoreductase subunit G